MAPLAVVKNNSDSTEKGLQLFYVNNQDNLGISLKNSAPAGPDPLSFFEAASDAYTGIIPVKSEIGSAVLNGLNLVVAITKHKPKDQCEKPTVNDVSIVSPVYQVLDQTNITNTTAAIVSNQDSDNKDGSNAWVYYLKGSDSGQTEIVEYELTTGNINPVANLNIDPDCSLAAFYDPINGGRSIIYQDKAQGLLVEYRVDDQQPINIRDSNGAKSNTSLAAAYWDGRAYVYYTDSHMNLYRITRDKNGKWSSHSQVNAGALPDPSSQFTAIAANGTIHLFYQAKNNKNITHFREKAIAG